MTLSTNALCPMTRPVSRHPILFRSNVLESLAWMRYRVFSRITNTFRRRTARDVASTDTSPSPVAPRPRTQEAPRLRAQEAPRMPWELRALTPG